jgi:NADPH:quinone reductase-like Zn-dependent oxidoreductase
MKAFIIDGYGGPERVRAAELPDPSVGENDVLIQIHAAGVNPLDSKIRNGEFKKILPFRLPLILGNEAAGVVVRVGSRVHGFKVGDEVYARPGKTRIGTFAEFIAIAEDDVALKPKTLTMEEAASIPLVGLTACRRSSKKRI